MRESSSTESNASDSPNRNSAGRQSLRRHLSKVPYLILIGLLIDLALVHFASGKEGIQALHSISIPYLVLGAAMTFAPWITRAVRVLVWARFFGLRLSMFRSLRVVLGTEIAAAVTPTAVGGAPAKVAMLYKEGFSPAASIVMTTIGSVEDGLFFILSVPVAVAISPNASFSSLAALLSQGSWQSRALLGGLLAVLGLLVFALVRWRPKGDSLIPRIVRKSRARMAEQWGQIVEATRQVKRGGLPIFAITMPLTAFQWTARYLIVSTVALGLGLSVDPALLFLLQHVVFTVMAAIPLPGATGGAEGSFLLLHRGLIPASSAGLLVTGWRFLTFHLPVAVAGIILLILGKRYDFFKRETGIPSETKEPTIMSRAG
jgi:uncharacterized protein (TIRG00374 family)